MDENKAYLELKEDMRKLLKDNERKSRRLDKIIKQSDKQQLLFISLNEKMTKQKEELDKLHEYDTEQQIIAKAKLDNAIIDDLKNNDYFKSSIIYQPADILSGDFYSLHVLKNNNIFAYVIDGQGHGISPALTVFAVSSAIAYLTEEDNSFQDIIDKLFPMIRKFLGEVEQLTYTMLYIDNNSKDIQYISGGMYPLMIKQDDEVLTFKANNLPFMDFSPIPIISHINIENWNEILIYTDGLVEDLEEDMSRFSPLHILKDSNLFQEAKEIIEKNKYEDDISVIKIKNNLI